MDGFSEALREKQFILVNEVRKASIEEVVTVSRRILTTSKQKKVLLERENKKVHSPWYRPGAVSCQV